MASDLAATPNSGMTVQLCGDAHLSNFGVFATPERRLVFDLNDFDETLPGPWEWDAKRLAASFEIALRERDFKRSERRAAVLAVARGYREQIRSSAKARVLDSWYDHPDADQILKWIVSETKRMVPREQRGAEARRVIAKARSRDALGAASSLVGEVDGRLRILANPPIVVPLEDVIAAREGSDLSEAARQLLNDYQLTLPQTNHPIHDFRYRDMARKVVGVGSVGTRAWILLLTGRDDSDVLLLQAKEGEASVLERYLGPSEYSHSGERVVRGQRLMQSATDIFLGWQRVTNDQGQHRDFYVRQLADQKGAVDVGRLTPSGAVVYAELCGRTLARSHARTGDRVAIAAYAGGGDRFDRAIGRFATAYADQNQRDYVDFLDAVRSGRLLAT